MWLGSSAGVPHGLFKPDDHQKYEARVEGPPSPWPDWLFLAITDHDIKEFKLQRKEDQPDERH